MKKASRLPAHGPLVATVGDPRGGEPVFPGGSKCCCYAAATLLLQAARGAAGRLKSPGRGEDAPCNSTLETKTVAGPNPRGYRVIAGGFGWNCEEVGRSAGETDSNTNWPETGAVKEIKIVWVEWRFGVGGRRCVSRAASSCVAGCGWVGLGGLVGWRWWGFVRPRSGQGFSDGRAG